MHCSLNPRLRCWSSHAQCNQAQPGVQVRAVIMMETPRRRHACGRSLAGERKRIGKSDRAQGCGGLPASERGVIRASHCIKRTRFLRGFLTFLAARAHGVCSHWVYTVGRLTCTSLLKMGDQTFNSSSSMRETSAVAASLRPPRGGPSSPPSQRVPPSQSAPERSPSPCPCTCICM